MNTLELLKLEFDGPTAPLVDISAKYLGISARKAGDMAKMSALPLPAFRLGSQKSPWLVELTDLAALIDQRAEAARTDWEETQHQAWPIISQE